MPRKVHRDRQGFHRHKDYAKDEIARLRHQNPILFGIAKGPWSLEWADREEEKGRSFSGQDIYAQAPNPPSDAVVWAEDIATQLKRLNMVNSLEDLYTIAARRGYPHDEEAFGTHLGCQAAGHGISWSDDAEAGHDRDIEIPSRDFYV
jgi:hypothetical protein